MTEHKYYKVPSPFPTLARGLFTTEEADGEHRVVVRGYDKFFNIGEVGWTTWPSIKAHTIGPYTLSLKSNGCVIFIAPLSPDKLVITSKHRVRVGPLDSGKPTHAMVGETWLRKYLAQKGRTEAELAAVLWEKDYTAVAELCDDAFEEHVLAHPPHLTGLHLHGLNKRTLSAFTTAPHSEVDAFAEEWGFIKTASLELPTVDAVREFTSDCAKTGTWAGAPVEGFVVRARVASPSPEVLEKDKRSLPPYPPNAPFFFKIKFDEPYMMYRDWREVTRALLHMRRLPSSPSNSPNSASTPSSSGKKIEHRHDEMSLKRLPQSKMQRPETAAYARWVIEEIRRDPEAFVGFAAGRGVIAIREMYLAHAATLEGEAGAKGKKGGKGVKKNAHDDGITSP